MQRGLPPVPGKFELATAPPFPRRPVAAGPSSEPAPERRPICRFRLQQGLRRLPQAHKTQFET